MELFGLSEHLLPPGGIHFLNVGITFAERAKRVVCDHSKLSNDWGLTEQGASQAFSAAVHWAQQNQSDVSPEAHEQRSKTLLLICADQRACFESAEHFSSGLEHAGYASIDDVQVFRHPGLRRRSMGDLEGRSSSVEAEIHDWDCEDEMATPYGVECSMSVLSRAMEALRAGLQSLQSAAGQHHVHSVVVIGWEGVLSCIRSLFARVPLRLHWKLPKALPDRVMSSFISDQQRSQAAWNDLGPLSSRAAVRTFRVYISGGWDFCPTTTSDSANSRPQSANSCNSIAEKSKPELMRDKLFSVVSPILQNECIKHKVAFEWVDIRCGLGETDSRRKASMLSLRLRELMRSTVFLYMQSVQSAKQERVALQLEEQNDWDEMFRQSSSDGFGFTQLWKDDTSLHELEACWAILSNYPLVKKRHCIAVRPNFNGLQLMRQDTKTSTHLDGPDSCAKGLPDDSVFEHMERKGCRTVEFASVPSCLTLVRKSLLLCFKSHSRNVPVSEVQTWLWSQRRWHDCVLVSNSAHKFANASLMAQLDSFVSTPSSGAAAAIVSPPGQGKSSTLAVWLQHHMQRRRQDRIIFHNFEASPQGTSPLAPILRLAMECSPWQSCTGVSNVEGAKSALSSSLLWLQSQCSSGGHRAVVVIDNIRTLRDVNWLPNAFPPLIRVILSVTVSESVYTGSDATLKCISPYNMSRSRLRSSLSSFHGSSSQQVLEGRPNSRASSGALDKQSVSQMNDYSSPIQKEKGQIPPSSSVMGDSGGDDEQETVRQIRERSWKLFDVPSLDSQSRVHVSSLLLRQQGRAMPPELAQVVSSASAASSPIILNTALQIASFCEHYSEERDVLANIFRLTPTLAMVAEHLLSKATHYIVKQFQGQDDSWILKSLILAAQSAYGISKWEACRLTGCSITQAQLLFDALGPMCTSVAGLHRLHRCLKVAVLQHASDHFQAESDLSAEDFSLHSWWTELQLCTDVASIHCVDELLFQSMGCISKNIADITDTDYEHLLLQTLLDIRVQRLLLPVPMRLTSAVQASKFGPLTPHRLGIYHAVTLQAAEAFELIPRDMPMSVHFCNSVPSGPSDSSCAPILVAQSKLAHLMGRYRDEVHLLQQAFAQAECDEMQAQGHSAVLQSAFHAAFTAAGSVSSRWILVNLGTALMNCGQLQAAYTTLHHCVCDASDWLCKQQHSMYSVPAPFLQSQDPEQGAGREASSLALSWSRVLSARGHKKATELALRASLHPNLKVKGALLLESLKISGSLTSPSAAMNFAQIDSQWWAKTPHGMKGDQILVIGDEGEEDEYDISAIAVQSNVNGNVGQHTGERASKYHGVELPGWLDCALAAGLQRPSSISTTVSRMGVIIAGTRQSIISMHAALTAVELMFYAADFRAITVQPVEFRRPPSAPDTFSTSLHTQGQGDVESSRSGVSTPSSISLASIPPRLRTSCGHDGIGSMDSVHTPIGLQMWDSRDAAWLHRQLWRGPLEGELGQVVDEQGENLYDEIFGVWRVGGPARWELYSLVCMSSVMRAAAAPALMHQQQASMLTEGLTAAAVRDNTIIEKFGADFDAARSREERRLLAECQAKDLKRNIDDHLQQFQEDISVAMEGTVTACLATIDACVIFENTNSLTFAVALGACLRAFICMGRPRSAHDLILKYRPTVLPAWDAVFSSHRKSTDHEISSLSGSIEARYEHLCTDAGLEFPGVESFGLFGDVPGEWMSSALYLAISLWRASLYDEALLLLDAAVRQGETAGGNPAKIEAMRSLMHVPTVSHDQRCALLEIMPATCWGLWGCQAFDSPNGEGTMTIDLQGQGISGSVMQPIALALQSHSRLLAIDLSGNPIGDHGLEVLLQAVIHSPLVSRVILANCRLTSGAAPALHKFITGQGATTFPCISVLQISHNSIGDPGAASISLALQSAAQQDCRSNVEKSPGQCLSILDIAFNNITGKGAAALVEAVSVASAHCNLRRLVMTGNPIGDRGCASLASLASPVANGRGLSSLVMRGCMAGPLAAAALGTSLMEFERQDANASVSAAASTVGFQTTARSSGTLSPAMLAAAGSPRLSEALNSPSAKRLTRLPPGLSSSQMPSSQTLVVEQNQDSARSLDFPFPSSAHSIVSGPSPHQPSMLQSPTTRLLLSRRPSLSDVLSIEFSDRASMKSSSMHAIRHIDVSSLKASEGGRLKPHRMSREGLLALSLGVRDSGALSSLDLSGTDAGAHLEHIIEPLCQSQNLQSLMLCNCTIKPTSAGCLANALIDAKAMTSLKLDGCSLQDVGVGELCRALQTESCKLRSLSLNGNAIHDRGALHIARVLALPGCKVQKIFLSSNEIGIHGAQALQRSLVVCRCLEYLDISRNPLQAQGGIAILLGVSGKGTLITPRAHVEDENLHHDPSLNLRTPELTCKPCSEQELHDDTPAASAHPDEISPNEGQHDSSASGLNDGGPYRRQNSTTARGNIPLAASLRRGDSYSSKRFEQALSESQSLQARRPNQSAESHLFADEGKMLAVSELLKRRAASPGLGTIGLSSGTGSIVLEQTEFLPANADEYSEDRTIQHLVMKGCALSGACLPAIRTALLNCGKLKNLDFRDNGGLADSDSIEQIWDALRISRSRDIRMRLPQ